MSPQRYILLILAILFLFSCKSNQLMYERLDIDDLSFVNFQSIFPKAQKLSDCSNQIQYAVDNFENVYFPEGDYYISKSYRHTRHNPHCILITNRSKIRNIKFHENAWIIIDSDDQFIGSSNDIVKILTEDGDIDYLCIDGLNLKMNKENLQSKNTGIFAAEDHGNAIKDLVIRNTRLIGCTNVGILTYAEKSTLENIYTERTSNHAIGARNPYNHGKVHYLYIKDFVSIDDESYSIDFSGSIFNDDWSIANPEDVWEGEVFNVKSIRSKRGIKTAGYWNLNMKNIEIIEPKIYGFFINKDAPGTRIKIDSLIIKDALNDYAMSISGNCELILSNVQLLNCLNGINLKKSKFSIYNLEISGKNTISPLRIVSPQGGSISNFTIDAGKDEVSPIWVKSPNIKLTNGRIINYQSPYGLLIHEDVKEAYLNNVIIESSKSSMTTQLLNLQKNGEIVIENCNIETIKSKSTNSRIRRM